MNGATPTAGLVRGRFAATGFFALAFLATTAALLVRAVPIVGGDDDIVIVGVIALLLAALASAAFIVTQQLSGASARGRRLLPFVLGGVAAVATELIGGLFLAPAIGFLLAVIAGATAGVVMRLRR